MNEKKPIGWLYIRRQLNDWSKPDLIRLVKDLYDASTANRDFLQARFGKRVDAGAMLEKYREKVAEQFFPKRGFGKLKLAAARRAIRDYRKATGDLAGTIDLMLTFVENGTEFTLEYGDIGEAFYRSLDAVLDELVKLLRTEGWELYPRFRERILSLRDDADKIGWGYGDSLEEQVDLLEAALAGE